MLNGNGASPLLDALRTRWQTAKPGDETSRSSAEIDRWQNALMRFQSVGHMKSWMVPVESARGAGRRFA